MAIVASRLKLETLRTIQRHTISRFTVPSVPATTSSPIYSIDCGVREGILQLFRVFAPTGTNYTIAVRVIETALDYSVYEVLRVETIDLKGYQEANLGVVYSNDEETNIPPELHTTLEEAHNVPSPNAEKTLLYFQIHNLGGTPTGIVVFELVIESAD